MNKIYHEYDDQFAFDNVYGHALDLLTRVVSKSHDSGIHIDIGCGYGAIAPPLEDKLGLTFVGIDQNPIALESLRLKGFETHLGKLCEEDKTYALIRSVIADRKVVSISFIDTLEHLVDGGSVLRAIARIASEYKAYCVVSTPNVSHRDICRKLVGGRWSYTSAGGMDRSHVRLFDNHAFVRALNQAGLHVIDSYDTVQVKSDQHFPASSPFISSSALIGLFLSELRDRADSYGSVNQFVRLCVACRPLDALAYITEREEKRPFLSIVIRTQGRRIHTLSELLTALCGQSSTDFEVIVVGHRLELESQIKVEKAIGDCPAWLREKIRLIHVHDGERTRPLNAGFENANGTYIAIMDDDDLPMAHWVETYQNLASRYPGRVLRATVVLQKVSTVEVNSSRALRAEGTMEKVFPSDFDLFEHLIDNKSPNNGIAFPRGLFHDLSMRFDESLTTAEDWDFIVRAVAIVGIGTSPSITAIYRWWINEESSQTVHTQAEWKSNYEAITRKHDQLFFLLPKGYIGRLRSMVQELHNRYSPLDDSPQKNEKYLKEQLLCHFLSSSWKVTAPLRIVPRLLGHRRLKFDIRETDPSIIKLKIKKLRRTLSWKISRPLRWKKSHWWDSDP